MTKITLDLNQLLDDGKITQEEADRFILLSDSKKRAGMFANLFMILGAIAVATGVISLQPSPIVGLILAATALGSGYYLFQIKTEEWRILSHGLIIMGCLGLAGWTAWQVQETWPNTMNWLPQLVSLILFTCGAAYFKQPFLAALVPLSIGSLIGSGTAYWHASYGIFVRETTITVLLFSVIAAGLYFYREKLADAWQGVLTAAARVAFFMVNFGFWVGSLWGDYIGELWMTEDGWEAAKAWRDQAVFIHEAIFSIGWVIFLGVCIWLGTKDHKRFLANTAVTFLAIHFYTQLFETLGAEPVVLVVAGITMLGAAFGITRFDRWQKEREKKAG